MADEGAIERRIAAWLYINKRYTTEQIIEDEELYSVYTNLGFLIIRSLINSEKPADEALIQIIKVENRELKNVKKQKK